MNEPDKLRFTRTIRTSASEQFLIHDEIGQDIAVADIHYASSGSVMVTLTMFSTKAGDKDDAQQLVELIDRQLLPMVSLNDENLVFNVLSGKLIGVFEKDK